jgi:hypothetical protein
VPNLEDDDRRAKPDGPGPPTCESRRPRGALRGVAAGVRHWLTAGTDDLDVPILLG